MKKNITSDLNINTALIMGAAVGAYFLILKPILEKTGIKDTVEEKELKKQAIDLENLGIWDPISTLLKKYKGGTTFQLLKVAEADQLATKIKDSWGYLNDDEEQVYAQFNSLRYQSQVSSLVDSYKKLFQKDLKTTLKSNLSSSEFDEIVKIINRKQSGIK